ncbi:toll/interleukin-1 receptor domain-containing protein [Pseudomonas sp. R1-1]|uniref:toll/interleukin-1 receptor domain-containing protein n=1 Tax=Pseudomonas sp. R1-1 TaxID=1602529 RepID=UPI003DA9ED22
MLKPLEKIKMSPKVFVSHASEDKERFVLNFAKQLRANGIDAWLDKWEMLPGDSLVTKIFEEGIKDAQAVIVVLSKNSVGKPWVQHELDAACVKRINTGSKLIPVVIDDCEVSEVLKATLWERIQDTSAYQPNLERIISSIFGVSDKPALGDPPKYVEHLGTSIAGHNKLDSLIYKMACEFALKAGSRHINASAFLKDGELLVPESKLRESIEILGEQKIFELQHFLGGEFPSISLTSYGFEIYARDYVENYSEIFRSVAFAITNKKLRSLSQIKNELKFNSFLIEHVLRMLASQNSISVSWVLGGDCLINRVSPSLERSLN